MSTGPCSPQHLLVRRLQEHPLQVWAVWTRHHAQGGWVRPGNFSQSATSWSLYQYAHNDVREPLALIKHGLRLHGCDATQSGCGAHWKSTAKSVIPIQCPGARDFSEWDFWKDILESLTENLKLIGQDCFEKGKVTSQVQVLPLRRVCPWESPCCGQ